MPSEVVTVAAAVDDISHFHFLAGKWKRVFITEKELKKGIYQRFVLCAAGIFGAVEKSLEVKPGEWKMIFSAPTFEVWDSGSFYTEQGMPLPLRLGLHEEEKVWLTKEVRRMMGEVLDGQVAKLSPDPFGRLGERQDLDVAVWVRGKLRASVIMIGLSCREALEVGAKRATWDRRFAPLTKEELPEARIEITLMSDLIFPVLQSDWERSEIDATKGYMVVAHSNEKRGWYLPAVHNVVSFSHFRGMLERLAVEKSGMTAEEAKEAWYGQCATYDWVETPTGILTLSAPIDAQSPHYL